MFAKSAAAPGKFSFERPLWSARTGPQCARKANKVSILQAESYRLLDLLEMVRVFQILSVAGFLSA